MIVVTRRGLLDKYIDQVEVADDFTFSFIVVEFYLPISVNV